ncbi:MAG: cysteine hydrolase family protein [Clostridiaceae bacterium]
MKKALFVIDIQEDFTGTTACKKQFPIKNSEEFIQRVNNYIDQYEKSGDEVIYIAATLPNNFIWRNLVGMGLRGTEGAKIDKRVKIVSGNYFEKVFPSSFTNKDLCKFIKDKEITHIELTGLDAAQCVAATASAAVKMGLDVTIFSEATVTTVPDKLPKVMEKLKSKGVKYI